MIPIGKYSELEIMGDTGHGLLLKDPSDEEIPLPTRYAPSQYVVGEKVKVFVFLDSKGQKLATTQTPKILLNEFARLEVKSVSDIGALMDWGLEKQLFAPMREQMNPMEEGKSYLVQLYFDHKTYRLQASSRIEERLSDRRPSFSPGKEVDLVVYRKTDLGYVVIINHKYQGIVFANEVFKALEIGDELKGYVKQVRDDGKTDVSIHPIGYNNFNDPNAEMIFEKLTASEGFLEFGDKSAADGIYEAFGISKKAFKKAIGSLYKQKRILIQPEGISLAKK